MRRARAPGTAAGPQLRDRVSDRGAILSVNSLSRQGKPLYERFYDDTLNNYLALAFGAESDVKLPFLGASWHSRADYLPSVTNWTDDYRLRGETGLLIPLMEQLSLKASVVDEYNSQPEEDTSANSLTTLMGLSLGF